LNSATSLAVIVVAVIITAGLLFGYDQGVISGALAGIEQDLGLGSLLLEVVTSWVTLGALLGSLAAGVLADGLGRRKTVLTAALLFILGAFIQAFAPDTLVLVAGRLVVGIGVGVAAVAAPLYGSEMASAAHRGRLVSAYQLAITIGIFLAYLVDGLLSSDPAWRLMLGMSAVPGILLALFALAAPETPRWLVQQGRRDEAGAILTRLFGRERSQQELQEIDNLLRSDVQARWSEVFAPMYRKPLVIALGLAIFQQITGINAIIYYADEIFAAAGFTSKEAQATATTWAIGATNVLATLIAIAFIDRLGRVPLLLTGLVGMGASLVIVGVAFHLSGDGRGDGPAYAATMTVVALIVFIISFAFSLGPVVWTVINEIFPSQVRGRGVAVATAVNWGSAFIVSEFFLSITEALGRPATFWLLAVFCLLGWVWIWRRVPETKGRSLEEIEQLWRGDWAAGEIRRA